MNREEQILAQIKEGLTQFSDELRGYRIILFGSRAAGHARSRSDFDLGVYGESAIPLKIFYRVSDFLEQIPTLYQIDWVDLNRASDALRDNALRGGMVIYG